MRLAEVPVSEHWQEWFREGLSAGVHALEAVRASLREGEHDSAAIRRIAGYLHGAGGAHGFPEVAAAAEGVVQASESDLPVALDGLLAALRVESSRARTGRCVVLVIEDDPVVSQILRVALAGPQREVMVADTGAAATEILRTEPVALIMLDLKLPDTDGRNLLGRLRQDVATMGVPVIVMTSRGAGLTRAECYALGADDYFEKPLVVDHVVDVVSARLRRAVHSPGVKREVRNGLITWADGAATQFEGLVGKSTAMQDVQRKLRLAAESDVTLLLTGESGTGKELAARAVHRLSSRKDRPFVGVNCSAFTETLLESELFGHVRGAFTDASRDKVGVFQSAEGGTLFLDEIGELSPHFQLKLLRVLEEREIRRVGDDRSYKVDVRLIGATNRDLRRLLASGAIREDFYYRVRVYEVGLPALRDRLEDLPLLVKYFIDRCAESRRMAVNGITRDAMDRMLAHRWPGNVRELRNVIEHAFVTVQGDHVRLEDLPPEVSEGPGLGSRGRGAPGEHAGAERERIEAALRETGGVRAAAARALGISRVTLWKKARKYGLSGFSATAPGEPAKA